jgi:hypothetical protein
MELQNINYVQMQQPNVLGLVVIAEHPPIAVNYQVTTMEISIGRKICFGFTTVLWLTMLAISIRGLITECEYGLPGGVAILHFTLLLSIAIDLIVIYLFFMKIYVTVQDSFTRNKIANFYVIKASIMFLLVFADPLDYITVVIMRIVLLYHLFSAPLAWIASLSVWIYDRCHS